MKNEILKLLEKNAQLSCKDIAKILDVNEEDVSVAILEMETDKIICGYNTIINWDKLEKENVHALIEVKVTPQRVTGFDKIASRICKFEEVDSVYLISGDYDFLVQINASSMKEISKFVFDKLSALDDVTSTATHFVLKKYKDHGISLEDSKSKRGNVVL